MLNSLRNPETFFLLALMKRALRLSWGWGGRAAWRKESYIPKTAFDAIQPYNYQAPRLCVFASDYETAGEQKVWCSSTAVMFSSPFAVTQLQAVVTPEHCCEGRSFHLGHWSPTICTSTLAKQPLETILPYGWLTCYLKLFMLFENIFIFSPGKKKSSGFEVWLPLALFSTS